MLSEKYLSIPGISISSYLDNSNKKYYEVYVNKAFRGSCYIDDLETILDLIIEENKNGVNHV